MHQELARPASGCSTRSAEDGARCELDAAQDRKSGQESPLERVAVVETCHLELSRNPPARRSVATPSSNETLHQKSLQSAPDRMALPRGSDGSNNTTFSKPATPTHSDVVKTFRKYSSSPTLTGYPLTTRPPYNKQHPVYRPVITVSKPSAKTARRVHAARFTSIRSRKPATHSDTLRQAGARPISVHTKSTTSLRSTILCLWRAFAPGWPQGRARQW